MHKHFRMLAISDYMKSQGYATPNDQHTRIPGIWKKLGTLYNLSALDDRVCDTISGDPLLEAMLNSGYRKSQYLQKNPRTQNNLKSFIARLVYLKMSSET